MKTINREQKMQEARDEVLAELPQICRDMLKLVRDPKMPPTSRVQLVGHLFRVGGLYETDEKDREKEPYEMTAKELAAALAAARANAEALEQGAFDENLETDDDSDILA
ncbi:hypothetical protein CO657_19860 [Rhizobium acidisoli]|uniref:Uncharacterized protein n=1 Tax=Rhizobium acidisoli TaxID=1538158 RepID=A0AAE5TYG9_9HYPH|nr:hypothetical protein [Rhizobium acidisoli]KPH09101.1 hypothetical protein AOG23_07420 [Rhizobium acidisoli]QAS80188.1 hypothetical protein CO657_19860 [Rhizobium acidisoli]